MADTKVTVDLGRSIVTVEGQSDEVVKLFELVRAIAPNLKEVRIVNRGESGLPSHSEGSVPEPPGAERRLSIREFARPLTLENTAQRIAVIAYWTAHFGEKRTFSVKEMNDWFGLCGFKKPTQMPVALSDARRKYDYVKSQGRDQWVITTGGENLVLELLGK